MPNSRPISFAGLAKASGRLAGLVAIAGLLALDASSPAAAFVGSKGVLAGQASSTSALDGGANLTEVGFRGRGFGGRGFGGRGFGGYGGFRGGRGYGYRGGGFGRGVGIGVGALAAGALIGGAIAASQAAPVEDDAVSYCASRFKSYDPSSGTYLGYDGQAHPCP